MKTKEKANNEENGNVLLLLLSALHSDRSYLLFSRFRHLYIKLCLCKRNAIKWQFKAQRCQMPNTQGSKNTHSSFFPTRTYTYVYIYICVY